MGTSRIVATLAVGSLLAGGGVAAAQAEQDTASIKLTSKKRAVSAGFSATASFSPERIVEQVTIALPEGSKLSAAGLAKCDKDEVMIEAEGGPSKACPASTRFGTGTATAVLGEGPAADFTLAIYNADGGMVLDILVGGQSAFRAFPTIKGRKLVIPLPRTKELNARITDFQVRFAKGGTKAKPFFLTPRKCPSSGKLTGAVEAVADGKTVVTRSKVACSRS